ncbi:class I SAM-dependent methyltransferase [Variovorax sp. IB41]|uniref:class I SAM-dependent methyltransferase n=1 Tax=Variovorax sp. IB41 TaxID=2779370 RepID=UPI0018E8A4BF|nr:SAM-dependent methyltransferase [Variovorax sp. IB41]MBJ2160224.1 SAM-dependent methyltransferase [Variovorax sp. IB41]
MPGYQIKLERIAIAGADDLVIRSLLDRQQYADPQGAAAAQGISSAAWPMFGLLWPSGAQLAARMAIHPVVIGARVLEIGCGLALASLVGHRRGNDMTASDCHPLTAGFLLENLRLNALPPMKYRRGHWGMGGVNTEGDVQGAFDLIIGSDLLYERDAGGLLAAFIGRHASPAGEVWIVDPDRGNRPAFNRQMADEGFGMCEERLDQRAAVGRVAYRGRLLTYRRTASG